jgi:hypothetical protein
MDVFASALEPWLVADKNEHGSLVTYGAARAVCALRLVHRQLAARTYENLDSRVNRNTKC